MNESIILHDEQSIIGALFILICPLQCSVFPYISVLRVDIPAYLLHFRCATVGSWVVVNSRLHTLHYLGMCLCVGQQSQLQNPQLRPTDV